MFTPSASRTRTRTIPCTVLIVGLVLLSAAVAAPVVAQDDDPPPLPASYYGAIEFNGEPAPAGITIEAEVNGEVVGSITTDDSGEYGGPTVADDKLLAEGDHSGAEVRFFVSGDGFDRTEADTDPDEVIWESGAVAQVDLSVPIDASEVSGGTDDGSTDDGAGGSGGGGGGDTIADADSAGDDGTEDETDSASGEDDAIDENTTDSEVDDEDVDDDAIGNETTAADAEDTNETTAADEDSGTGAATDEDSDTGAADDGGATDAGDDGSTGGSETDDGNSGDGADEAASSEEDVLDDDSPGFGVIAAIAAVLASIALSVRRDRS